VHTEGTTTGCIIDTKHNNGDFKIIPTTSIYSPLVGTTVGTDVLCTIAGMVVQTEKII